MPCAKRAGKATHSGGFILWAAWMYKRHNPSSRDGTCNHRNSIYCRFSATVLLNVFVSVWLQHQTQRAAEERRQWEGELWHVDGWQRRLPISESFLHFDPWQMTDLSTDSQMLLSVGGTSNKWQPGTRGGSGGVKIEWPVHIDNGDECHGESKVWWNVWDVSGGERWVG